MKETPPVLTAGPAAWIRDRAGKRSRLLGTRPSRAAGGQATGRAEIHARGSAVALSPPGARGRGGLSPPQPQHPRPRKPAAARRPAAGWEQLKPAPSALPLVGRTWRPNLAPQMPEASMQQHPGRYSTKFAHRAPRGLLRPTTAHKREYPIPLCLAWGGKSHIWRHPRPGVVLATTHCALKADPRV